MQKFSGGTNKRRPVLLWVLTGALLAGALGWTVAGDRAHDMASAPIDAAALTAAFSPLDLNSATAAELDGLPGIGPALAQNIIDRRESAGPFRGPEDLLAAEGIGPALWEGIASYVCFSP